MRKWFNITTIAKTYLVVILIFFVFRLILFFTELGRLESFSADFKNILLAFLMGVRFDIVISGYILSIPLLVLSILFVLDKHVKWLNKVLFYWVFVIFSLAFLVCAADIPYFGQFFSRFSVGAFQWIDSPMFMFKMIFQEPRYFLYIIPFIFLVLFFFWVLKKIFNNKPNEYSSLHFTLKILVSLVFMGLVFIGIRGRVQEKSPIKVGTAYFCDNAFLNQLGLNPLFTLMRSYLDQLDARNKTVQFMHDQEAIRNVRNYLGIDEPIGDYPIARQVNGDSTGVKKYNVIVVIMESMSAAKMARHGNPKNLTPFLDSLSYEGYYFENIYTAGIHTFNGIFSTFFSFPAIFRQNPMKESTMYRYNGIGSTLRKEGYSTTYFTTHDGQFDNVEGFLRANDFENIYTVANYPSEKVKTTLGVPDDFMFEFSMPFIDELYGEGKPFFVAFMTASDHGPFYIPEYFHPRNRDISDRSVEYADWSLRKFVTLASQKEWFDNTLFVFVADHGAPINAVYDIPLDYHHSPLLFYGPGIITDKETYSNIGGQIDIFPTIMGILNQPYINNTLGIDLFRQTRPYIFFNHDDKLGVIDRDFLLILKEDGEKGLFRYRINDKKDYQDEMPEKVKEMELYNNSNLQVFQYLIQHETRYIN